MTNEEVNEEIQAGVVRYWERLAKQHDMTVDEYREYRRQKDEERRKEWGLSMADAITRDDAYSLREYAQNLAEVANSITILTPHKIDKDVVLGEAICALHDRLRLVTAMLDRIEENRL